VLIQFMAEANSFWTASKTDSVQELPRTQTSLSRRKFALKERRERERTGENRLPMVSCASTTVTRISSLPLSATRKTKRLGKRTDQEVSVVSFCVSGKTT